MSSDPRESSTVRRLTWVAVAIGFALRLARPEVHSLWIDEGMTVAIAEAADPFAYFAYDSHPPLSFLAFRVWIACFGTSDLALRLLPALVACGSLVLFAQLARRWLGPERSVWAVATYAVAPILVGYAHEVRMYAFVELAALLVFTAAYAARAKPTVVRWSLLALATATATGLHYYGALAGLACITQALVSRDRTWIRVGIATGTGVLVWIPWIHSKVPMQMNNSWPIMVKDTGRDWLELPGRLIASDFIVLPEHGVSAIGWILGALALIGLILGSLRAVSRRSWTDIDVVLAVGVPVLAAFAIAKLLGGGFQPRYLTPAIPGAIALITLGLASIRPVLLARTAAAALIVCAGVMSVLQLSENRREDYRSATQEIRERWRDGDRLLLLVCVPDVYVSATVDHYLRDRPDILAARLDAESYLAGVSRPPAGTRVHVIWREATVCSQPMVRLAASHTFLEDSGPRFRIHRRLTQVP